MKNKKKFSSGGKWEKIFGYSRAIKIKDRVIVTGTTSVDDNGNITGINNAYLQTKFIFQKIEKYLKEAGAELNDVVLNRIYVINITDWEDVAKAHFEFFSEIRPCCTMIEVSGLINPDMLVEIETEAVIEENDK